MNTSYTYLLVDFFTVIVCFIFSFHPRIQFHKQFGSFIKASILAAIPFIVWDIWFAKTGVWWFNSHYTLGINFYDLPLEEWLFFICIPFSCLFTYYCLTKFFNLSWANAFNNIIVYLSCIVLTVTALVHYDKMYTFVTFIFTTLLIIYLHFIARALWIGQSLLVWVILMLGFLPVNGILTGSGLDAPIVNYNSKQILNIRLLTIPIEDIIYGYAQFILNIYLFDLFKNRKQANGIAIT
ncbi:MAG: lycopene cyclase domain-containing protein [Chitinophagaceae bacterium]